MNIVAFLVVLVVLYCLWASTVRSGLKGLSCRRSFSEPAVFAGQEGALVEVVRNDKPYMIPWLRLESRISPNIRLGSQDNLHVSGEMYYCSLFTLMPHQQIRRTHRVRFLRRGAYDLGNASLTAGDMLGLWRAQRTQELSAPVLVFPQLLQEDEIPAPLSRLMDEVSRQRQLLQDPFLIRSIRPYQPGDPVRDIHWPATARVGEVQLRVREYTIKRKLMVILNVQYDDTQWQDTLPEQYEDTIEYAISLAATLCGKALQDGISAGFGTNMCRVDGEGSVLMLPSDGAAREEELFSAMARLRLYRDQPFTTWLGKLVGYSDLDILILSLYDSDSVQQQIRILEQGGNHVTMHLLEVGNHEKV